MRILIGSIAALWIFAALSPSAFAVGPTLCTAHEDPLFACSLENKKLASVCVLNTQRQNSGYEHLVYRYGTKEKIELSFPQNPAEFRRRTSVIELVDDKSMEDDQFVRFTNGRISYVLYAAVVQDAAMQGVAVFDGYRLLRNIKCLPDTANADLQQKDLTSSGVPLQDADEALRYWKAILPSTSTIVKQRPSVASPK